MRVASEIVLTNEERTELMKLVRSRLTSVRLEQRAGIVLLAADGFQNKDIAQMLSVGRVQVSRWRQRYGLHRLGGIERDLPRGAPPVTVDVARLVELTNPEQTRSGHTLEYPNNGRRARRERCQRVSPLACPRIETTSGARLQGLA